MDPLSPIQPEETILRRVPKQKGMSLDLRTVQPGAFAPNEKDTDGLSVHRAGIHTPKEVAQDFRGQGSQPVWVAHLRARDILAMGMTIEPKPVAASVAPPRPAQPGHAIIPDMNAGNASSNETEERKRQLAAAVFQIDGPFDPPKREPPANTASPH